MPAAVGGGGAGEATASEDRTRVPVWGQRSHTTCGRMWVVDVVVLNGVACSGASHSHGFACVACLRVFRP